MSACHGCTDKICRKGEKCIENVIETLARELCYGQKTKYLVATSTHSDRMRALIRQRKIRDRRKR